MSPEDERQIEAEIHRLYDEYLAALQGRDRTGLLACVDAEAHFSVGGADGVSRWEGAGREAVERLIAEVERLDPGASDLGMDVHAVSLRSPEEAVVLLERWIDNRVSGERRTSFGVETVRLASGSWRMWRSVSETATERLT